MLILMKALTRIIDLITAVLYYSLVPRKEHERVMLLRSKTLINGIPDSEDLARRIFASSTLPL